MIESVKRRAIGPRPSTGPFAAARSGAREHIMNAKDASVAAAVALESLESRAYLAAGGLDPTFGNAGKVTTDFTASALSQAAAVITLPDGRVIAVGSASAALGMTRFLPDGRLDTSFGKGGQAVADLGGAFTGTDALRLADGRILVAGVGKAGVVVARFTPDGALDATFGAAGKAVASTSRGKFTAQLAVGLDGKIVVAANGGETYQ